MPENEASKTRQTIKAKTHHDTLHLFENICLTVSSIFIVINIGMMLIDTYAKRIEKLYMITTWSLSSFFMCLFLIILISRWKHKRNMKRQGIRIKH